MAKTVKKLIKELKGINPNAQVRLYFPYDIEEAHPEDLSSDEFEIFTSGLDYDEPFIELFSTVDMNGNRQQEKWIMIDVLDRIKETWAEEQVESSFDDWKFVTGVLKDHFLSQVEDKNKKEFIEYLEELNYDEDIINNMFKRSEWWVEK